MYQILKKIFILITITILAIPTTWANPVVPQNSAERHFWSKLDRRLEKQAKQITKLLRKKSDSKLQVELIKLQEKNKLGRMYNITATMVERPGNVREQLAYFASVEYQQNFKTAVVEKILSAGSFENYLQNTMVGRQAFICRLARGSIRGVGVALLSVALAGGIGLAIALPAAASLLTPATTIFLGLFTGGSASGIAAFTKTAHMKCPGE